MVDLYKVTDTAETLVENAMDAIEQEMALCNSVDEKYSMLVLFLGMMAAKYIALQPQQKLTTDIMAELVKIEQANWKEYQK